MVSSAWPADAPGRYQLVAGPVDIDDQTVPVILRIDTATGKTWLFQVTNRVATAGPDKGKTGAIVGWVEVPEDYFAQLKLLTDPAQAIDWLPAEKPK